MDRFFLVSSSPIYKGDSISLSLSLFSRLFGLSFFFCTKQKNEWVRKENESKKKNDIKFCMFCMFPCVFLFFFCLQCLQYDRQGLLLCINFILFSFLFFLALSRSGWLFIDCVPYITLALALAHTSCDGAKCDKCNIVAKYVRSNGHGVCVCVCTENNVINSISISWISIVRFGFMV